MTESRAMSEAQTLYESIRETLEVMDDPELMAALRRGVEQASADQTIPWDQVKNQIVVP